MTIIITYKNGTTLEQKVNYLHVEDSVIWFTVDSKAHAIYQEPVRIPLENVQDLRVKVAE